MNEASEQYSEDIILSINRNMGKRDAGFLYKHQKGITGGVPTDRNAFDPTYVLRMAAGGQKVLTLDSNCLDDTWTEEDVGGLVASLRRPRLDTGESSEGSEGSEGSAGSSEGGFGSEIEVRNVQLQICATPEINELKSCCFKCEVLFVLKFWVKVIKSN